MESLQNDGAGDVQNNDNISTLEHLDPPPSTSSRSTSNRWPTPCRVLLIVGYVIIFIVVPSVLLFVIVTNDKDDDGGPPEYDYDCFNSTYDLLRAQQENLDQDLFILCPERAHLVVDSFPGEGDDKMSLIDYMSEFDMLPLIVIRSNITIQCGLDGYKGNDCLFDGGFLQVMLLSSLPAGLLEGSTNGSMIAVNPTYNVTIRGMTFNGPTLDYLDDDTVLGDDDGVFNLQSTGNIRSVLVGNPGSVEFVDCMWAGMRAHSGFIYIGTNPYPNLMGYKEDENVTPLDPQSASVTFRDCFFYEIVYDGFLAINRNQEIKFIGGSVRNIQLPSALQECSIPGVVVPEDGGGSCQGFLLCLEGAICAFKDFCIENFEYTATAGVLTSSEDSQAFSEGYFSVLNLTQYDSTEAPCPSGATWFEVGNARKLECMNPLQLDGRDNRKTCPKP